jgi:hypothetical protein
LLGAEEYLFKTLKENLVGYEVKPLEKSADFIRRKLGRRETRLYGEIEPKYPNKNITANLWLTINSFHNAFESDKVTIWVELEHNRMDGVLKLPLSGLQGDFSKIPVARGSIVEINIPQAVQIELESGETFLATSVAQVCISWPGPVRISEPADYRRGMLIVFVKTVAPISIAAIKSMNVPPPSLKQPIPKQASSLHLRVSRRAKVAIPILS